MSRAVRRQQQSGAPKESAPKTRLTGIRTPRPTRGAKPPATQKRGLRLGKPAWFEDIFSELKKVSWPSREETIYLTTVVAIVAVVVGTILGGIDIFFNWVVDEILLN